MMSIINEVDILSVLQKGVTAAVAASINPALPVSYIGTKFNVPNDQTWLEIIHIPNNRTGDFWGNEKNHQGLLRLILHWPNNDSGPYAPLRLLGSIADYFRKGRVLPNVEIYEMADFTGVVEGGDDLLYPASIRYQAYRRA